MAETSADPMQSLRNMFQRHPPAPDDPLPDGPLPDGNWRITLHRNTKYLIVPQLGKTTTTLFSGDSDLQINQSPIVTFVLKVPKSLFEGSLTLNKGTARDLMAKTYDIEYRGHTLSVDAVKVVISSLVSNKNGGIKRNPAKVAHIVFKIDQVFKVLASSENGYIDVWPQTGPQLTPQTDSQSIDDTNRVSHQLQNGWTSISLIPGPYYYFRTAGPDVLQLYSPENDLLIANNVDDTIHPHGQTGILYKGTICELKVQDLVYMIDSTTRMPIKGVKLKHPFTNPLTIYDLNIPPAQILFRTDQVKSVMVDTNNRWSESIVYANLDSLPRPARVHQASSSGQSEATELAIEPHGDSESE